MAGLLAYRTEIIAVPLPQGGGEERLTRSGVSATPTGGRRSQPLP